MFQKTFQVSHSQNKFIKERTGETRFELGLINETIPRIVRARKIDLRKPAHAALPQ
jgi:hypothetical protein